MELIQGSAGKDHRTALVVDGDAYDSDSKYQERVNRTLQSFNGPNIKVNVFVVRGEFVIRCSDNAIDGVAPQAAASESDPVAVLTAAGYDLVLPAVPGA